MTAKKVINIISLILFIIAIISLYTSLHNFNATYNIWAEEEDLFTSTIMSISVFLAIVIIFVIIMIPAIKKTKKITKGKTVKKPSSDIIKRYSTIYIRSNIFEIILFLIISEEIVYKFGVRTLNMNFTEAEFLAGGYQIFENHLLFIAVIMLIDDIMNYFTAESQSAAANDSNYNDNKQTYDNEIMVNTYSEEPSYITCPSCGFEQPSGRKFCWKCFTLSDTKTTEDTISKCPNCGAKTTKEMLFCGYCGNKIKEQ